jgi:DNA modification methylase
VIGRGAYHWQHEPCFYAVREGATAGWIGDRKQSTVWEVPNVHRTRGTSDDMITDHGTQKPVEVMARPIRNHTGDVYEPFSGSGSTLIAAEQLGRRCYAMEIEPKYVQMAIERWQAYTGGHAERI